MMTPERAGKAVGYAKKAAEAAPKMGQVLDTLGWAYPVNGENELAGQTLKRGAAVALRIRGSCITLQWCMERKGINKRNRRR
jgi:hypothetical protein